MDLKTFILILTIGYSMAKTPLPKVTGTPKHNFLCPSYFSCSSKTFGNYKLDSDPGDNRIARRRLSNGDDVYDYFVSCAPSGTWCMACAKRNTWYDSTCDQCLFLSSFSVSAADRCHTTPTWKPATTPNCPAVGNERADRLCEDKGAEYCGNVAHYQRPNPSGGPAIPNINRLPTRIFLMCWMGKYRGCHNCQEGLLFKEGVNWKGEDDIYGHCS